ncbi:small GTPase superfamily, partial [Gigaspora rosea]
MYYVTLKLVVLGEAATGKSCLVLKFVYNDFNESKKPNIGAAFLTKKVLLEDRIIKLEIWDTSGKERFHSLTPLYYRSAHVAIVVYDVTKASTLDKAKAWVKELQCQANSNIIIALVGNKIDLIQDFEDDYGRQVSTEEAMHYVLKNGLLFFETSAKNGDGVQNVFEEI